MRMPMRMPQRLPSRRHDADFYAWTGPRPEHVVDGRGFRGPAFYHRVDAFGTIHLADHAAAVEALPSDGLQPVRWFDGSAVVQVVALRYSDVTLEVDGREHHLWPYGEIGVWLLAAREPVPRGVAALSPARFGVGAFVVDLPVTTLEARDLGREIWGFPKFVADMEFREEPHRRRVVLSEGDRHVFTLAVHPGGPVTVDRAPQVLWSSLDGELLETSVPMLGHQQRRLGRRSGVLQLGDHPVASRLRSLGVSAGPVAAASYLDLRIILPAGVPVGPAREHRRHEGTDRSRGRFTVEFPGALPVDQYQVPEGVLA